MGLLTHPTLTLSCLLPVVQGMKASYVSGLTDSTPVCRGASGDHWLLMHCEFRRPENSGGRVGGDHTNCA